MSRKNQQKNGLVLVGEEPYVVCISTLLSSSIWNRPSKISGRYVIMLISGTAFNTDIHDIINCREKEFLV